MSSNISNQLLHWPMPPEFPVNSPAPEVANRVIKLMADCRPDFNRFCSNFQRLLKRLRFAQLRNICSMPSDWNTWVEPLYAWANDFCYRPGDYCMNIGLSVTIADISQEQVMMNFSVRSASERWFPSLDQNRPRLDFAKYSLCMCTVIRARRDTIDWAETWDGTRLVETVSTFDTALSTLVRRCEEVSCLYGILTDGTRTLFVAIERYHPKRMVHCQYIDAMGYSLAYCIAAIIQNWSKSLKDAPVYRSGALPDDFEEFYSNAEQTFTNTRDFDLYALERSRTLYERFLGLIVAAGNTGLDVLPNIGSKFSLVDLNIVGSRLPALRANDDCTPLAPETISAIFRDISQRPFGVDVQNALTTHGTDLIFEVTEVIQHGWPHWSQVYVGQLHVGDRFMAADTKLCLKLFDERFFSTPGPDGFYDNEDPRTILLDLMIGDDMLVREESAYDRLKEYQGRILPHCYGFHEFSMPDGARVVGILMEYIDGNNLEDVLTTPHDWTLEDNIRLLRRVRDITKILSHSGVNQHDWLPRQLICRPKAFAKVDESRALGVDDFDLVLVDFACATQVWGCERGALLRETPEITRICRSLDDLGVPGAAFRQAGWAEPDECENYEIPLWV